MSSSATASSSTGRGSLPSSATCWPELRTGGLGQRAAQTLDRSSVVVATDSFANAVFLPVAGAVSAVDAAFVAVDAVVWAVGFLLLAAASRASDVAICSA